jgi:hypothetical protein
MNVEDVLKQIDVVINSLYENNANKLEKECRKVMSKFGGIYQMDYDNFYSKVGLELSIARIKYANELVKNNKPFNESDFRSYLSGIIYFAVCKEMTKRNRKKRMIIIEVKEIDEDENIVIRKEYIPTISLDTPLTDDKSVTIADTVLDDNNTIEKKIFEEDSYSEKMLKYLSKLSMLQKEVLQLTIAGYSSKEIIEKLHITNKQYSDSCAAIHSYRNVSVLF